MDDTTWEFTLRQGAKFSNGQPFTPQDVIFTFCRVMNNEQSIGGSTPRRGAEVRQRRSARHAGHQDTPAYPLLPNDMSRMGMLWAASSRTARSRST